MPNWVPNARDIVVKRCYVSKQAFTHVAAAFKRSEPLHLLTGPT